MESKVTNKSSSAARLDSWKAIAEYLGRSSRTVMRWHAKLQLPVHHLAGRKSSVFAYPEELDKWFASRGAFYAKEPQETARPELFHTLSIVGKSISRQEERVECLIPERARIRSAELTALAHRIWEVDSHGNLTTISHHFRQAIDLDPGNASAYAGLSLVFIAQGLWGSVRTSIAYSSANAAVERALEIDPELPEAKCAAAWIKMISLRDWPGAGRGFDEALSRQIPNWCAQTGRALLHIAEQKLERASQLLLNAKEMTPLGSFAMALHSWNLYLRDEFDMTLYQISQVRATGQSAPVIDAVEALACIQLEERIERFDRLNGLATASPHNEVVRGALGYAFARAGSHQEAGELLKSMTDAESRGSGCEPYAVALILIGLNEKRMAVERLEQSYREGSLWSLGFRSDPIVASLRKEPTFRQFLRRACYPEPQDTHAGSSAAD
jgi:tetratricopeptide (TPR) repeat protein